MINNIRSDQGGSDVLMSNSTLSALCNVINDFYGLWHLYVLENKPATISRDETCGRHLLAGI